MALQVLLRRTLCLGTRSCLCGPRQHQCLKQLGQRWGNAPITHVLPGWAVGPPRTDPHCCGAHRLLSIFHLRWLRSFAYFNPLKLEKLFNKLPANLELVDMSQLNRLIRPWFKHRWGLTLFTTLGRKQLLKVHLQRTKQTSHISSWSQEPCRERHHLHFGFIFTLPLPLYAIKMRHLISQGSSSLEINDKAHYRAGLILQLQPDPSPGGGKAKVEPRELPGRKSETFLPLLQRSCSAPQ